MGPIEATRELLVATLSGAGIDLPPKRVARLSRYVEELLRWSRRMSLTSMGVAAVVERLVLPSIRISRLPAFRSAASFADLGSGAGIPGVVLQIADPRDRCVLIEARQRRAVFLRHLVRTLGMTGVRVEESRAEALRWQESERVELVTCRAVAPVATLLPWCEQLLTAEGKVVVSLGPQASRREERNLPPRWEWSWVGEGEDWLRLYYRCST